MLENYPLRSQRTRCLVVALGVALTACVPEPPTQSRPIGRTTDGGPHLAAGLSQFQNGDFEADAIGATPPTGWTVLNYLNSAGISGTSSAPPATFAGLKLSGPGSGVNETFVVGGTTMTQADPDLGTGQTFRFPAYGTRSARVNYLNAATNGKNKNSNLLRQLMTTGLSDVDPVDGQVHVRFAIAPVLENPSHAYNQQPYYYVELLNVTKGTTLYSAFNVAGQAGVPWHTTTSVATGNAVQWLDWQLVDVAPGNASLAVGDQVQLTLVASGCSLGGHFGRIYVDGVGAAIPGPFVSGSAAQSVAAGSTLTYTLRYSNGGTSAAIGTHVDFTTPPQTTFASVSLGSGCTAPSSGSAGTVSCSLGTLNPGGAGSFTVTVNVASSATGSVVAGNYLIGAMNAPSLLGSKVTTSVIGSSSRTADISVTKVVGAQSITPGSTAYACPSLRSCPATPLYTIVVTNPSAYTFRSKDGRTVSFSDVVPSQITGVTWSCTAAGSSGTTSKCRDGSNSATNLTGSGNTISLSPRLSTGGGTITVKVYGTLSPSATGTIANSASAAVSGIVDPDLSNNSASASFAAGTPVLLTVTKIGSSYGTVSSAPSGISCGATCATSYPSGTQVLLSASPIGSASFTGWSGASLPVACTASPVPTTCLVTLSAAKTVTATFAAAPAPAAASAIYVYAGDKQLTRTSVAFARQLQVLVTDANGTPLSGKSVAFSAPGSGARATLSSSSPTTNSQGIASVTAR